MVVLLLLHTHNDKHSLSIRRSSARGAARMRAAFFVEATAAVGVMVLLVGVCVVATPQHTRVRAVSVLS